MVLLAIIVLLVLITALVGVFLFGFRLGGDHWKSELDRVHMESIQAQRRIHDLTRQAFVAIAEHVEKR